MKYISENLEPLLIGFCLALIFCKIIQVVSDIIIKIALIKNP